jgi:hypothetical protein
MTEVSREAAGNQKAPRLVFLGCLGLSGRKRRGRFILVLLFLFFNVQNLCLVSERRRKNLLIDPIFVLYISQAFLKTSVCYYADLEPETW